MRKRSMDSFGERILRCRILSFRSQGHERDLNRPPCPIYNTADLDRSVSLLLKKIIPRPVPRGLEADDAIARRGRSSREHRRPYRSGSCGHIGTSALILCATRVPLPIRLSSSIIITCLVPAGGVSKPDSRPPFGRTKKTAPQERKPVQC